MNNKLNREELAALEVGHTTVSKPLAGAIIFCFLILIISIPVLQLVLDYGKSDQQNLFSSIRMLISGQASGTGEPQSFVSAITQKNNRLLEGMEDFEKQLEESSFLRNRLLAPGQRILLSLGYGNEKVYPGDESWLFYRPDMDYLMGPAFLDKARLDQRREGGKLWRIRFSQILLWLLSILTGS